MRPRDLEEGEGVVGKTGGGGGLCVGVVSDRDTVGEEWQFDNR